jgi:inosose dehydratase
MTRKLKRREFLGLAATAPLLFSRLSSARMADATHNAAAQKFGIGHNLTTYISGGRGPDGFWKGVEEIAKLGVRATEADNTPSRLTETYEASAAEVKERLAKHDVQLVAIYQTLPVSDAARFDANLQQAMRVGRFLKNVGGEIFNLAGGARPQPDPAEEFKTFGRFANELGKRLREEYGLRLGYHPHTGTLVQTREEVGRMMDVTRPEYFAMCPDTGHLKAGGADPLEVFKTYRSRIIYMHYKDWDPELVTERTAQTGRKGGFVELGKGVVDFKPITEFLLATGYDGWVMIELDRAPGAEIDAVKHNLDYMKNTLGLKLGPPSGKESSAR